jgi:NADH-ubiquinone oxidoreductase chain 2
MILTSALNSGFVFITLIAILTSVISAVYYLFIIKTIFSEEKVYKLVDDRNEFEEVDLIEAFDNSLDRNESEKAYLRRVYNNSGDISKNTLSSSICLPISIVTMFLTLYILDSDVLNIVQFLINN